MIAGIVTRLPSVRPWCRAPAITAAGRGAVRTWMGADKREALRALLGDPGPDVVEKAHTEFVARLTARYRDTPPTPMAGVPEAFAALRAAGVRIGVLTGGQAADELAVERPTHILAGVHDLPALLGAR